ncbi:zinc finger, PHD-type, C1-like protein [Tanacetum coccineum]
MGIGYKHFSHTHKLEIHDMPEGAEVTCSGCNSPATQTIYVCWQCNFFLHEQCFHATRSKKHPSHPLHPLTLAAYPTYPENSFYCNSCKIMGTGFSYSCSDCDFNLHVHCAYLVSNTTNSYQPHPLTSWPHPDNTSSPDDGIVPPNLHSMLPNIAHMYPFPTPNQATTVQYPTSINQDHYLAQNFSKLSVTPSAENAHVSQNFITSNQNSAVPQYPKYITQDSYVAQIASPFSPPNPKTSSHYMHTSQNFANISTSAQNSSIPQYPTGITQDSNTAQNVSQEFLIPPIAQNPNTTPQKAYTSETYLNFPSSGQNLPIPQNTTYSLASSAPYEQPSHHGESGKTVSKKNEIIHFSHPHSLLLVKIKHGKKKKTCSGCQETLIGKGYACSEKNCGFQLDEACFNLKKEIWHNSHPAHPLALLLSTNEYDDGMFICSACLNSNTGFTYQCSICQYDLDIKCANLKETVKRDDHEHALKLYYECPLKEDEYTFYCDVCNEVVSQDHWTYYCQECDYGTHSDCVDREKSDDLSGDPNAEERTNELTLAEANEIYRISAIGRQYALDLI